MKKLHSFLLHTSLIKFITTTVVLGVVMAVILSNSILLFSSNQEILDNPISDKSIWVQIGKGIVLKPFLETFFYQVLFIIIPLKFMMEEKKSNYIKVGLFSAFLFGVAHFYNFYYIFYAFGLGLYFSYITLMSVFLRKNKISVWLSVYLIHLIINSLSFLGEHLY